MTTKNTFKEHLLRVVAVVGLIAVLLLGAWGIIQLAFFIPTLLSNLANGGVAKTATTEKLVVSLPTTAASGQAVTLSWSHTGAGTEKYAYSASYACASGISLKATLPTGALQSVPCNTPFNYTNAADKLALVVSNSGTMSASAVITVSATKLSSGAVTSTGSASTAISAPEKAAVTKAPAKTATTPKYVASGRTTNLYGYPDLQVRITGNPGTVRAGSQVSLQFVVENVGTNVTPQNWAFTASLPYNPVYTFQSQGQQALYPGDKIVYTLGYTAQYTNTTTTTNPCNGWTYPCTNPAPVYGGPGTCNAYGPCNVPGYQNNVYGYTYPAQNYGGVQTASVTVDPMNYVLEQNESNNTAGISYQVY